MTPRLTRDAVALALTPHAVLLHFGLEMRRSGDELRGRMCPSCGERNRESVAMNMNSGRWSCFAHGCKGDLFAFVAGLSGLDVRRDFERVLQVAADIAGVSPSADAEQLAYLHRRQVEREAQARARQQSEHEQREQEARMRAGVEWRSLNREHRNATAERYIRSRGLDPSELMQLGAVRYYSSGDVASPLWALTDGELVNVVRRRCERDAEPKVLGLRGCPTAGTFGGRVLDVGRGLTVIVEGVADTWTAIAAWPDATVLGAHGAGNLSKIADAAAPRVCDAGGCVVVVPHRDRAGEQATAAVFTRLADGGIARERVTVLELGHKDLNDAWQAGWRPAR